VLGRIGRWVSGDLARALARTAKDAAAKAEAAEAKVAETKAKPVEPDADEQADDDEHDDEHEPDFGDDEHDDEHEPDFGDDEHDDDEHEREIYELVHDRPPERPAPPPHQHESPALASLRNKLHGFQVLVQRGELAKAAIVARDVQQIIERFDPVEFLPSLFAGYFRTMNRHLDELLPHLGEPDGTPWQVLSRLYQADLDGFIEE
jgi:hypothetical protein